MELSYHGANCVRISTKNTTLVIDDNLKELSSKTIIKPNDVVLQTFGHDCPEQKAKICIDQPGEYEVGDVSIIGVAARAHMDDEKSRNATIYKLVINDISIVVVGHVYEDVTEDLEDLGHVDVLFVPVGNKGYTLDGAGASKVIKEIDPKIVIPTHYADSSIKYQVPQDDLNAALRELGMEPAETINRLKLKTSDIPESLKLYVLERQ